MYPIIVLDYPLNSLAPNISILTMNIHYNDIYKNNLITLNKLLNNNNYNYNYSLKELINNIDMFPIQIRGEILYYLSSILNHNLYFYNISNKKNILPTGKIKEEINKSFGNFNSFKQEFIRSANNLKGSGYTFLVKNKEKLQIINTSNEDSPYSYGFIPIICLDLWEHAYFLDYHNNRSQYINNFFNIIDFNKINIYYEKISSTKE